MVVSQVIDSRARLTELERRIKETEDLEKRLEALEQARVRKEEEGVVGGLKKRIEAQEKAIRDSCRAEVAEKAKARTLSRGAPAQARRK
jgi:hypothetical protein